MYDKLKTQQLSNAVLFVNLALCHMTQVINQLLGFYCPTRVPHRSSADETAEADRESALVPPFHGPL